MNLDEAAIGHARAIADARDGEDHQQDPDRAQHRHDRLNQRQCQEQRAHAEHDARHSMRQRNGDEVEDAAAAQPRAQRRSKRKAILDQQRQRRHEQHQRAGVDDAFANDVPRQIGVALGRGRAPCCGGGKLEIGQHRGPGEQQQRHELAGTEVEAGEKPSEIFEPAEFLAAAGDRPCRARPDSGARADASARTTSSSPSASAISSVESAATAP